MRKDHQVLIIIQDNGDGIDEDARKKIFQPFFTTKPTGGGNTGLGLYICYDIIVNHHHDQITVESEKGNYTRFTVILSK
ncbi:MAG: hypothetical protein KDC80_07130 [Saprospiraceae bacterium]|nr:hypothetical protein [Saprospiraceae bacterium]